MSLDASRRRILCDNAECGSHLSVPLTMELDAAGARDEASRRSPAAGWVFVRGAYEVLHYCPRCGGKMVPDAAA